jgi:hypothetical protein
MIEVMQMALIGTEELIDIHHRNSHAIFNCLFCSTENRYRNVLDRSRMQERPVKILVKLEQLVLRFRTLKLKFSTN